MVQSDALRQLVADQTRAFPYAELLSVSSKAAVSRAVSSGWLSRVLPCVYAHATHACAFTARADAALLWAQEGSVIAGTSAMWVWGLLTKPPAKVHVLVPQQQRKDAPDWLSVTRVRDPGRSAVVGRLVVSTPADAIVRGFSHIHPRDRSATVYRAVQRGLVSPEQLSDALLRTARVPERRRLEQLVASARAGAESFLEERALRAVFNTREFANLLPQHDYFLEGWTYRIDLYDPVTRTAFEIDSAAHHGSTADRLRDIRRDAHLATDGVLTVRFSYQDIMERPHECRRIALEILRARSAGVWN